MVPPPARRHREGDPRVRSTIPSQVLAGRALVRGRLQPIEIGIDDEGRIIRIGKSLSGEGRHDVGDSIILPSATDLHVHFREPGPPESADNLASGTQQAALGGVGLVADMPNTVPPISSADRILEKVERSHHRLAVDLLVYALASDSRSIAPMSRLAGAFKLFLAPPIDLGEPPTAEAVRALVTEVAATGLPLSVHAEDPRTFRRVDSIRSLADWDQHRPVEAEIAGVSEALLAPESLRLHVAHVTAVPVAQLVAHSGNSFEATPHHLLLSSDLAADTNRKVNPPLRSESQRAELWEWFRSGKIPCLASDHAPHLRSQKDVPFPNAASGMPGVETMLPLLLAKVRSTDLDLRTLLRAACDNPARWLGVPQGRLALGHRANLLVVDFRARVSITARHLHAPCGWTAFEGWEGIFPREHYLDGHRIVTSGEYSGEVRGRVVRPEYAPFSGSILRTESPESERRGTPSHLTDTAGT
jgi:dihydroorotase